MKKCHHCFEDKVFCNSEETEYGDIIYFVECMVCHACGPTAQSEKEAIELWHNGKSKKSEIENIKAVGDYVAQKGLTPFDLVSWAFLLEMEYELGKTSSFIDLNMTHELFKEVTSALCRKAKNLDKFHCTDFHTNMIKNKSWFQEKTKLKQN